MASERSKRRVERLLDEADDAISRLDWESAKSRAQAVLAFEPDNNDAIEIIAAANRALGLPSDSASTQPDQAAQDPHTSTTGAEPHIPSASAPEAERRQLTVMFCDLQGSTALSQQLDPEVLRDVIRSYQEVCAGAVGRFEGHISKYLGDGLLVYFGYPQAHEDDPQRAVRAGLAILEDMGGLNARLRSERDLELTVRIGIHTGLVVAGEMGGGDTIEELAIVGETPNIAARIEGAALPNSVVVSNITANLIEGFFLYEALGPHELKGISEPVELFRVLEESGAQTRFEVAAAAELSPLVGRDQELGLLLDRWEQAQEGLGQVVLLGGEAGIGKSRLIDALTKRLAAEPHTLRWLRCSAYHQNSAFHPFLEYSQTLLGIDRKDSAKERLSKLENALSKVGLPLAEAVPLLSGVLSIPLTERFPELAMSPEWQRQRTLELLVSLVLDSAEEQPVLIVVEDLHWADPSTLAVLGLLIDQAPTISVLALLSFRPEFTPPWGNRAHTTPILLNRLTRRLATDMINRLTGGKTLPEEIITQVASKSDGVPLFVEELIHMVVESDLVRTVDDHYELTGPLAPLAIPSTLQDSLTARLDRLATVREVAQIGAVLGKEFTYELIEAVSPLDAKTLRNHLQHLVDSEFLYQRGPSLESTFIFKHALVRDAAYESLLHSRRQQYHQRAAQVLEAEFPDIVESQPELLAHHFTEAGLITEAVSYLQRAGERALATYGYEEAITHFERGLLARGIALSGTEMASDDEAAALLFGLARAQTATFERQQFGEAFGNLSRAFEYYAEVGNVALAVAAAEFPIGAPGLVIPGVAELMTRALTLGPADSHESGRLLSRYGGIDGLIYVEGDDDVVREQALGRALTIAQREGDIPLEIRTLMYTGRLFRRLLRHQEGLEILLQAANLARSNNDLHSEMVACYWAALAQSNIGDLEGMRPTAAAGLHAAERVNDRAWLALTIWGSQMAAMLGGEWQAARDLGDRGLTVSPRECRILYTSTLAEYEVGDFDRAEANLDMLLDAMRQTSPGFNAEYSFVSCLIPMVACITGKPERMDVAAEAAQTVLSSRPGSRRSEFIQFAQTGLGLMAVLGGNAAAAQEQYAALESMRGLMLMLGGIANDRLLGLLSQTMGNLDQAEVHFEDAMAFCRKSGYRPELAWSCSDYAGMLINREDEGDRSKATGLLQESMAISTGLGMRPLMERVTRLQARVDSQPEKASAFPDGLTQREVEVLQLICGGKTDREIAEELFISFRTVGNHVRSILNKTGTVNRTEAASYANQHGLATPISDDDTV